MEFRVGQRVACVRVYESEIGRRFGLVLPKIGAVFTIRGFKAGLSNGKPINALLFDEYPWACDQTCFRPLTERSTDAGMSILRKILTDAEKEMV